MPDIRTDPLDPRPDSDLSDEQRAAIARLESMGYLNGTELAPVEKLVTVYDDTRTYEGVNLVHSGHRPAAWLMDMNGRILHTWSRSLEETFPGSERLLRITKRMRHWQRIHLFDNGDLLVLAERVGIVRLDKDSNVVWFKSATYHHDFELVEDGSIWLLKSEASVDPRIHPEVPVLHDFVVELDQESLQEPRRISLYDAFMSSPFVALMEAAKERVEEEPDLFHTNTLELLDHRMERLGGAFRRGNLLLSLRTHSILCVLDPAAEAITWATQGPWRHQHEPAALPNGHLLLFDNKGGPKKFGRARVIEYDVASSEIIWSFEGGPSRDFHSVTNGRSQRLPNGNTLITETHNGRAFEVTAAGEIVWEYVNPYRVGDDGSLIASLWHVLRLDADFPLDWLRR